MKSISYSGGQSTSVVSNQWRDLETRLLKHNVYIKKACSPSAKTTDFGDKRDPGLGLSQSDVGCNGELYKKFHGLKIMIRDIMLVLRVSVLR